MPTRASGSRYSEDGSLAPLGIGLALISLTAVLAILAAGSLYLTERRLTALAESTALAVLADSRGNLSQPLDGFAHDYLGTDTRPSVGKLVLVEAYTMDTRTVTVRLCSLWSPIFDSYMFSETGKVCSEALARRGK